MNASKRNYTFYGLMLLLFAGLSWWVVRQGKLWDALAERLVTQYGAALPSEPSLCCDSSWVLFLRSFYEALHHPVALLFLQLLAILIAVRLFSWLFKYLGQPGVIGEIVAGIVLGPSLLGHFFPEAFQFLFAPESLEPLQLLSQIGLVLFMFVIGMELDLGVLRRKGSQTLVISHASIFLPFLLGLVLAWWVYPRFGFGHTTFVPFALFVGISVSITAFPVLARIIQERGLGKSSLGRLSIASAANNDITAWCMLAAIIAVARAGSVASAGYTLLCVLLYLLLMVGAVRPFMRKLGEVYNQQEVISKSLVAFIFLVLILSSYITELLGVHALFGAFVAGVIMPTNINFRRIMTEKIEDVALVLLLPLFFVFTGLRTEIGLLNTPSLWGLCLIFIAVSMIGKLAGASLSARFVGESWHDSLSIGVLMNTRGLMELIVLNIGYEMGVLPASIYVIFVIMALVTTFLATPMLDLIDWFFVRRRRRRRRRAVRRLSAGARILVSLANPSSGPRFLRLLYLLCGRFIQKLQLSVVHYTIGTETNPMNASEYGSECFIPIRRESKRLGVKLDLHYGVTDHYLRDLSERVHRGRYDFLLIGGGPNFLRDYLPIPRSRVVLSSELNRFRHLIRRQLYFPGETVRDKARRLFAQIPCTVGVFVDRDLEAVREIGVILLDGADRELLHTPLCVPDGVRVTVRLLEEGFETEFMRLMRFAGAEKEEAFTKIACSLGDEPLAAFVARAQLLLISYRSWLHLTANHYGEIERFPSFVVVRPSSGANAVP